MRIGLGTNRDEAGAALGYPFNNWRPGPSAGGGEAPLTNGVWYRYEWQIQYLSALVYRIYPRIYNMAGTLLYDYTSYYQNDNIGGTSKSLQTWYETDGKAFGITNASDAKDFGIGNEGPGGSSDNGQHWYIANVALSTSSWLGA